jgi:hypothetical protein
LADWAVSQPRQDRVQIVADGDVEQFESTGGYQINRLRCEAPITLMLSRNSTRRLIGQKGCCNHDRMCGPMPTDDVRRGRRCPSRRPQLCLTPSFCSAVRSGLLQFLRMNSSDPKLPQKKRASYGWPFALIAACGIAFGLYSLGQHLFSPDPEFTQGYLIFSVVLDLIIIVACGVTITFFVIQRAASGSSDPGKR